jgi:hypothetical protein
MSDTAVCGKKADLHRGPDLALAHGLVSGLEAVPKGPAGKGSGREIIPDAGFAT